MTGENVRGVSYAESLDTEMNFIVGLRSLARIEAHKLPRTLALLQQEEQESGGGADVESGVLASTLYDVLRIYRELYWPLLWHTALEVPDPERAYDLEKDAIACTSTMFILWDISIAKSSSGLVVVDFVHGTYNALGRPHFRATLIQLRTGNFVRSVQRDFVVSHSATLDYTGGRFVFGADQVPTHTYEHVRRILVNTIADAMSGWKVARPALALQNEGLKYLRRWRDNLREMFTRGEILGKVLTDVLYDSSAAPLAQFRAAARLREKLQYGRLFYLPSPTDMITRPSHGRDIALMQMALRASEQMRIDMLIAMPGLTERTEERLNELYDHVWLPCMTRDYVRRIRLVEDLGNAYPGNPNALPPAPASPRIDSTTMRVVTEENV